MTSTEVAEMQDRITHLERLLKTERDLGTALLLQRTDLQHRLEIERQHSHYEICLLNEELKRHRGLADQLAQLKVAFEMERTNHAQELEKANALKIENASLLLQVTSLRQELESVSTLLNEALAAAKTQEEQHTSALSEALGRAAQYKTECARLNARLVSNGSLRAQRLPKADPPPDSRWKPQETNADVSTDCLPLTLEHTTDLPPAVPLIPLTRIAANRRHSSSSSQPCQVVKL
eukprot:NODE_3997_length_859_cov_38.930328_g3840_i0.p1 GENE.NODE_3997_length_859_cov_38.930328_g3840_i0~~NODE_3997_length_859_cov_38.930328_g3840_i0.p1  ORF type:complete len:259 (+),score=75.12 NODE_3997_length_859_cov_38.930328_g3840_i0:75-779(+)